MKPIYCLKKAMKAAASAALLQVSTSLASSSYPPKQLLITRIRIPIRMSVLLILAICLLDKKANAFSISFRRACAPMMYTLHPPVPTTCSIANPCAGMGARRSNCVQLQMEIISFDSDDDDDTLQSSTGTSTNAAFQKPSLPVESAVFAVGSLVSVSKKGLKAFNVPTAVCGSYDGNNRFVPSEETNPATKFLILPVGLQGEVLRVIDPTISAKHPVQVKFEAGPQPNGLDLPAGFSYHFATDELELIK
jgi:hypothetical protein